MNIEQRKNIAHALLHLTSNHIAEDVQYSAWYCGKKSDFISRHKKAIAYLEEILAESNSLDKPFDSAHPEIDGITQAAK